MPKHWYVARTHPNLERFAQEQIEGLGFETFVPRTTLVLPPWTRSGARRRGTAVREIPMFPCYVLILIDLQTDPWQRINRQEAVVRLLPHCAERPDPIREDFIDDMRDATRNGKLTREQALELATKYAPGDLVPVIAGLFEGQAGIYLSKYRTSGELFVVLQMSFGRHMIPADCVARAPSGDSGVRSHI
jgi:transcription antitermination factor NusG